VREEGTGRETRFLFALVVLGVPAGLFAFFVDGVPERVLSQTTKTITPRSHKTHTNSLPNPHTPRPKRKLQIKRPRRHRLKRLLHTLDRARPRLHPPNLIPPLLNHYSVRVICCF
jgi:hypothetical protein